MLTSVCVYCISKQDSIFKIDTHFATHKKKNIRDGMFDQMRHTFNIAGEIAIP